MRSSDVEGLKPPAGRGRGFAIPVRVTVPPSHVVSASDPPRETDEALEQRSAVIRAAPADESATQYDFKESSSDNNRVSITSPPQLRDNLFDTFQYLTPAVYVPQYSHYHFARRSYCDLADENGGDSREPTVSLPSNMIHFLLKIRSEASTEVYYEGIIYFEGIIKDCPYKYL